MGETPSISLIIPVFNGDSTLGACLQAAFSSKCDCFDVIVVDDCSQDGTAAMASSFPCTLIRNQDRMGVSETRNVGARASRADVLFFTDADCMVSETALSIALETIRNNPGAVIGGTYTPVPADPGFFSRFQSILIHFFETKRRQPDYVAAHALVIERVVFERSGGFASNQHFGMAAGVEDVEFSHRLRRLGHTLIMKPDILVRHHFGFNLMGSLKNAWRKSLTWTSYSIANRDLLGDSGAASIELKCNVSSLFLCLSAGMACFGTSHISPILWLILALTALNVLINGRVLAVFFREGSSLSFAAKAVFYYLLIYPLPVGTGALVSVIIHFSRKTLAACRM